MNTLMAIANDDALINSNSWLQSSVQEFFSTLNWEDSSLDTQQMNQVTSQDSDAPLSLDLSVSNFFTAVNWEGAAIAAAVSAQPQPTSPESFTLDDFSALFS